jgi:hypothetical protein
MDQTLYLTVKCSIYIMAVGVLQGDSVKTAAQNVKDKLAGIVLTAWKFWPLIHCITYSVIPAQHRILWVNMVDLVWNAILSSISQKDNSLEEEAPLLVDVGLGSDGTLQAVLPFVEETKGAIASTISSLGNGMEEDGALETLVEADLTLLHTTLLEEVPVQADITLLRTTLVMEKSSEADLALLHTTPEDLGRAVTLFFSATDEPANGDEAAPSP